MGSGQAFVIRLQNLKNWRMRNDGHQFRSVTITVTPFNILETFDL